MNENTPQDTDSAPPLREGLIPTEKPPFTGFLWRLLAFIIDGAALYFIGSLLNQVARPALLGLNPVLPYLGHLLALGYFWLGNGPLTQGRTAGKAFLGLHVIDAQGQPLSHSAALKRALFQAAVFFVVLNPSYYSLLFPPSMWYGSAFVFSTLSVLSLTLLLTLAVGIAMHPRKRGWHDLWADSYVTRNPTPSSFQSSLQNDSDVPAGGKSSTFIKMTVAFWAIASVGLLIKPIQLYMKPESRQRIAEVAALQGELKLSPYIALQSEFPNEQTRQAFLARVGLERERALKLKQQTIPTTDSLRTKLVFDGETIITPLFRKRGAFSPEDLNSPEFRASMERLRTKQWTEWRTRRSKDADAKTSAGTPIPARAFVAQLFEPMQILIYNKTMLRARVHGPADPAAGALSFEEVTEPRPARADQATTTSQAAGSANEAIQH